jgi:predicted PurR-regulated permease PerM
MVKKRVTLIFLSALTALALAGCFILFRPFLYPLVSALIIGIVFAPVHHRVERLVRNRGLAAALSTLLVILVVALPLSAILLALSHEVAAVRVLIEQRSEGSGGFGAWVQSLLDRPLRWLSRYVDVADFDLRAAVLTRAREIGGTLVTGGVTVLGGAASFLVNAVISLFTLFFVFREGQTLRRRLAGLLPLTDEQIQKLFSGVENTIVGTVYGGLVVAGVQGALVGLALWALGVESPVLWGVMAAFFALLPLVGTAVVWVPAALYLVASGRWGRALMLVAWCTLVVGMIDNVLRPLLLSGRVEMHPLLIFFAVFGGVSVFGFLGLIIGPVIVAVTATLLGLLRDESRAWVATMRES